MQVLLGGIAYPTKVEVSFRESSPADWAEKCPAPRSLVDRYGGIEFSVSRYEHAAAVVQKVNALATRSDVQARDVFDLDWLLGEKQFPERKAAAMARLREWHEQETLETATGRCLEIGDDQYRDQVESFLDADTRARFAGKWDEMRLRVHAVLDLVTKMPPPESRR